VRESVTALIDDSTTRAVFDGDWHHVILIDANGTVSCYIDGEVDSGLNGSYTRQDISTNKTSIGYLNRPAADQYFGGVVDDFRIYGYALSSAQARQLYNSYHGQYGLVQSAVA